MDCPNNTKNAHQCNCTYPGCPRHGVCCECLTYHRHQNELPACYFNAEQESTWDRSVRYFIRCQKA